MRHKTLAVAVVTIASAGAAVAAPSPARSGTIAYRPVHLAERPATPPANTPASYDGPSLRVQALPVGAGNLGFEPMVAVDAAGTAFYNARIQLGSVAGKAVNEQSLFRSTDAGEHWTDISGGPSQHWTSQDPYLYADPDTGRVFWLDMVTGGATMSFSDDKGATWTTNHIQDAGMNDHPTMTTAVVPAGSGLSTTDAAFDKVVYHCTNTVVSAACARSVDGGRTFVPTAPPLLSMSTSGVCNGALAGHMASDGAGRIYIGAADCGTPWVSVSDDGGQSWRDVVVSDGINTPGIVNGEHDVNLAVDDAGNVYAVWVDDRDHLPYLSVSTDHGDSWQTPMMVAPPGVTATEYVSISAGSARRVALSFIGTHGSTEDNARPWDYYVAVATDMLSAQPLFVAAVPTLGNSDTTIVGRGFDCCSAMKDFLSVTVAPTNGGRVWGSLSDACTGACVADPAAAGDNSNIGAAYVVREIAGPALRGRNAALTPRSG